LVYVYSARDETEHFGYNLLSQAASGYGHSIGLVLITAVWVRGPFRYTREGVVRVRSGKSLRIRFIIDGIRLRQADACAGRGARTLLPIQPPSIVSEKSSGDSSVKTCLAEHHRMLPSPRLGQGEFRAFSCSRLCTADSDRPRRFLARLNAEAAELDQAERSSSPPTVSGIRQRSRVGRGWPESRSGGP